ncbi:diguanylate cyclase domain-containing protein [Zoogloea sp.]|uniref:bifunctional diguanylate cyclase/phosphodiesterase n=1 Tax=Zoogloea sp. TaxID=49181 RepID=UPI0035B126BD
MKALPRLQLSGFGLRQYRLRLVFAVLVLNLMVIGLAWQSLTQSYTQSQAQATTATQNIALLLEHDVEAYLDKLDLSLKGIVDDLETHRTFISTERLAANLQHIAHHEPHLEYLAVIDARGTVHASSRSTPVAAQNLADWEYFRRHRDSVQPELLISPPFRSKVSDAWVISLSRRIKDADGRFGGIVLAQIRLSYFKALFSNLDLGPNGAVSLRDSALGLVARVPDLDGPEAALGSRTISPQLANALKEGPEHGSYTAPTKMDQVQRSNSYRRMAHYPFYVIVGLAEEDYLTDWHQDFTKTALQVCAFVIGTLTMLALLLHAWAAREADLTTLSRTEHELRTLLETAPDAILIIGAHNCISHYNHQTLLLLGFVDTELRDQALSRILPELDERYDIQHRTCADLDLWAQGNGRLIPVSVSSTPLSTEQGPCVMMILRDITERREREEALRLASLVYQAVGEAIIVTDPSGKIIAINPAFTRLTGFSPDQTLGQSARILQSGRHDQDFYRSMWESLESTGSWKGEILNRRSSGEVVADWLMISTIYDADNQPQWRVGMYSSVTAQKRAEESLWRQASYDVLTGLPNRRLFLDRLQQEMSFARRTDTLVALLLIDLDHFKEVNDRLGHLAGDQVLVETAQRIRGCIRATDTAARLGGDEFAVILGGIKDPEHVESIAQSLVHALAAPHHLHKETVKVSGSIGISFYPTDAESPDTLFEYADRSMYAVKTGGRNGVARYMPPDPDAPPLMLG